MPNKISRHISIIVFLAVLASILFVQPVFADDGKGNNGHGQDKKDVEVQTQLAEEPENGQPHEAAKGKPVIEEFSYSWTNPSGVVSTYSDQWWTHWVVTSKGTRYTHRNRYEYREVLAGQTIYESSGRSRYNVAYDPYGDIVRVNSCYSSQYTDSSGQHTYRSIWKDPGDDHLWIDHIRIY